MTIKIIPGKRDEALIEEIKANRNKLTGIRWEEYISTLAEDPANYDALYYACPDGDKALREQEHYFEERLFIDEKEYYASRMGGYEFC